MHILLLAVVLIGTTALAVPPYGGNWWSRFTQSVDPFRDCFVPNADGLRTTISEWDDDCSLQMAIDYKTNVVQPSHKSHRPKPARQPDIDDAILPPPVHSPSLILAVRRQDIVAVRLMFTQFEYDNLCDERGFEGSTALIESAKACNTDLLTIIMRACPRLINVVDAAGRNALNWADQMKCGPAVEALLMTEAAPQWQDGD